ncbi:MAG: glycosyltransferase family 4 protein [Anaerolineales bacterium]|nr:glycosyltransferase family 4 protein [Anaerolineales bacterium]
MRIGVNGFFLGQPTTGSGQYTENLLRELLRLDTENQYVLFSPSFQWSQVSLLNVAGSLFGGYDNEFKGFTEFAMPNSVNPRNSMSYCGKQLEPVSKELDAHVLTTPFDSRSRNLAKLWFEQVSFPRACRRLDIDLAHVPYFASPLFPTAPTVVTVHDLIPLILPAYRGSLLVRLYTRLVAAAARKAEAIITVSQASERDIVRRLHIPPERIHVTYEAAGEAFRPVEDEAQLIAIRRKYALPERYLLYLGGFDRRKNLPGLLRAFALLVSRSRQARLVVAGKLPGLDSPMSPDPRRLVRELAVEESVVFTGWVSEEDKPSLLSGATAFVFPSLYEGFGLPPLEAMACGAPVVASNCSSLPEVVGQGGILVGPTDVEALAEAMEAILVDDALRAKLRSRALAQAAKFSWKQTALETLAVYRKVVGC